MKTAAVKNFTVVLYVAKTDSLQCFLRLETNA